MGTEREREQIGRIAVVDDLLGTIYNEQNAERHRLQPSDAIPLSGLRSLTPDDYEGLNAVERKRLLHNLVQTGGVEIPEFLRQHLRLFSGDLDIASGPTLVVREAKLMTSMQSAIGQASQKLEEEFKAAPIRPVGGAPGLSVPPKNAQGLFEIRDPRELANCPGMVSIPDSGNFANPKLPSKEEFALMSQEELIALASDLKYETGPGDLRANL